jgi:hypothetical protein
VSGANLTLRAALEVAAIAAYGAGGYALGDGGTAGVLLAAAFVVAASLVWGTFNVPGDPSRSGKAPVPVPGLIRLLVELDLLIGAAVMTGFVWSLLPGIVFGVLVVLHYAAGHRRIAWLLQR